MAESTEKKQKAEYRSAKRSRKMIREAFLTLLKQKSESRITVTDIVNLADINRTTFYAHYPNVHSVVEEIENDVIEKMMVILKDFNYFSFFKNPAPLLLQISRFLEMDLALYKQLIRIDSSDAFLDKLKKIFADFMENDPDIPKSIRKKNSFAIRISYFTGGIVNAYRQYLTGELDCSLNDISMEIASMIINTELQ